MDDDKIRDLFRTFQPELTSECGFLSRLEDKMKAIDMVKRQIADMRRRNRIAVAVAAVSGFVVGVVLTLLMPMILDWSTTVNLSVPRLGIPEVNVDMHVVCWTLMAAVCVLTVYGSYELTVAGLSRKAESVAYGSRR